MENMSHILYLLRCLRDTVPSTNAFHIYKATDLFWDSPSYTLTTFCLYKMLKICLVFCSYGFKQFGSRELIVHLPTFIWNCVVSQFLTSVRCKWRDKSPMAGEDFTKPFLKLIWESQNTIKLTRFRIKILNKNKACLLV